MKVWENIIIGSGPSGAITALTLAENGQQVLILEEGQALIPDESRAYTIDDMIYKYRNGGVTAALGSPKIAYVEGSVVGGGSEVNAGLYHRTPPEILEDWKKEFECQALDSPLLDPLFEYCEKLIHVTADASPPPQSLKMKQGADLLGWSCPAVPRWIHAGERQSMSKVVLPKAVSLGAQMKKGVRVLKFSLVKELWKLETSDGAYLCHKLYLCGGAIATPSLALRSGVSHNIGRSLQMHPSLKFIAEYDEDVNPAGVGISVHQVKQFSPRFSLGCSISSLPYLAVGLIDHLSEMKNLQQRATKMAIFYSMIKPTGHGKVINIPFQNEPLVSFKLNSTDLQNLKESFDALGKVLFASGATQLFGSVANSRPVTTEKDLLQFSAAEIKNNGRLMTIHLFSSCPMGENKKMSATDSFGKVWNRKNLYINDASLLCNAPGVNPQGTIMAVARRNVLQHLGRI